MKPIQSAIGDLLHHRAGGVEEFEAALSSAYDAEPWEFRHSKMMIDAILCGSRNAAAADLGRGIVRIITPYGDTVDYDFEHTEKRAKSITKSVHDALVSSCTKKPKT